MWIYEKRLEYPVNITKPDLRMAKLLLAQYGGPDSELGAALRYLTQRYSMPDDRVKATLTDIGTEELAHYEMIGTMIRQCMQGATCAELDQAGLAGYYTMHDHGVFPVDPNGVPFTTAYIAGHLRAPDEHDGQRADTGAPLLPPGAGGGPFPAVRGVPGDHPGHLQRPELLLLPQRPPKKAVTGKKGKALPFLRQRCLFLYYFIGLPRGGSAYGSY